MPHSKITAISPTPGLRLTTLIDDYLATKRAANLSPKSLSAYRETLDVFVVFLTQAGISLIANDITREHVMLFLEWDRGRGCKDSTVHIHFMRLAFFWNWACREEPHIVHPMARMQAPKIPETLTPIISTDEFQAMLDGCKGASFTDRRDHALLLLAYDSGIRLAGLTGLTVKDIDVEHGEVKVRIAKGDKEYITRFGEKCGLALRRYLRRRAEHAHARLDALWLTDSGALSERGMQFIVKRAAKYAGLDPTQFHVHQFRHTAAHNLKETGISDEDIMELFNWDDPKSAARYGKALRGKRARQHYISPADRLGKKE